jgi:hypothetical protein
MFAITTGFGTTGSTGIGTNGSTSIGTKGSTGFGTKGAKSSTGFCSHHTMAEVKPKLPNHKPKTLKP